MAINLNKQGNEGATNSQISVTSEDELRKRVAMRIFDNYCSEGTWNELIREGVESVGLDPIDAKTMINMELEALGAVNEKLLIEELNALLHRFTSKDKKLDQKERDDALQYVCKPRPGYKKGLDYQIADQYITEFCQANRVKVKVGMFKWEVP